MSLWATISLYQKGWNGKGIFNENIEMISSLHFTMRF